MQINLQPPGVIVNKKDVFDSTANGCNNFKMEHLAYRLRKAREAAKLSQAELARRVGVTQQSVQKIEVGKTYTDNLIPALEKELGVPKGYLLYGIQSQFDLEKPLIAGAPILQWEDVVNWPKNKDEIIQDRFDQRFSKAPILGSNSFILVIRDDQMESHEANTPYFRKNSHIVVDPDKKYKNLDFVIVKIKSTNTIIFRQYRIDDMGYEFLRILSDTYKKPVMDFTSDMEVIGVVVAHLDILI